MSTISAGTTTGTALVNAGDTTGTLVFQTNGTTTALTLGTDQSATLVGKATLVGTASTAGLKIADVLETATVSAIAATGTIAYDVTTQVVLFYTSNASANWTVNFRGSSGTSLNTLLATGESLTAAFLVTQGSTAYFNSAVQVDGTTSGVTTRWQGGTAPAAGNASGVDIYTYTIIKTANATFSVFAAQTRFA
jgi:hypothetical protein